MKPIVKEILDEKKRANQQFGEKRDQTPAEWCLILGEEVGEVNKAALNYHFGKFEKQAESLENYREELIQVAAVALNMVEHLDAGLLGKGNENPAPEPRKKVNEADVDFDGLRSHISSATQRIVENLNHCQSYESFMLVDPEDLRGDLERLRSYALILCMISGENESFGPIDCEISTFKPFQQ